MRENVRAVHWRAVLIGFGVGIVIAVLGEATAVGELLLPDSGGCVLAGLLGGFVAGFVAGGSARTGAFTGGLASVFGGLGILGIAVVLGVLFSGIVTATAVLVLGVLLLGIYAIPGAIGGVIGAAVKGRRDRSAGAERSIWSRAVRTSPCSQGPYLAAIEAVEVLGLVRSDEPYRGQFAPACAGQTLTATAVQSLHRVDDTPRVF